MADGTICDCCEDEDAPTMTAPGRSGDDCLKSGIENCNQTKSCFVCPCRYAWYSCQHCQLCCKSICSKWTRDDFTHNDELARKDKLCNNNNKCGALCCPFTTLAWILSPVAICFLGFGSVICCISGSVLKLDCCDKVDRRVSPDSNSSVSGNVGGNTATVGENRAARDRINRAQPSGRHNNTNMNGNTPIPPQGSGEYNGNTHGHVVAPQQAGGSNMYGNQAGAAAGNARNQNVPQHRVEPSAPPAEAFDIPPAPQNNQPPPPYSNEYEPPPPYSRY